MGLNTPAFQTDLMSMGPAVAYIGPAGVTPTTDLGAIADDGVSLNINTEMRKVSAGNPKTTIFNFVQAQEVMVSISGLEWALDKFAYGLGGGTLTNIVGPPVAEQFDFGGAPCPTEAALRLVHDMCSSGDQIEINCWRVQGQGNQEIGFGGDLHTFKYDFECLGTTNEWDAGAALGSNNLLRITKTAPV